MATWIKSITVAHGIVTGATADNPDGTDLVCTGPGLLGKDSAGSGAVQVISVGTGLLLSAGALIANSPSPGGSAGGDLGGTYPNPTVAKINGVALGTTTATAGNILIGSGTQWVTKTLSGSGATFSLSAAGVLTISAIALASLPGSGGITVSTSGGLTGGGSGSLGGIIGPLQLAAVTNHAVTVGTGAAGALTAVSPSATSGVPLVSQGASADPAFGTAVVAGGGTGQTTLTAHSVLVGNATTAVTQVGPDSTVGKVLTGMGSSADPAYHYPMPGPNYAANGGMWFAQRQVATTLTTISQDKYGPDRWRCCRENADLQYQQVDTNGATESGISARYYGTFKKITNTGKMLVCQPLEGSVSYDLGSNGVATVTFQAKLKASASKTIRLGLLYLTSSGTMDSIPANVVPTTWGANSTDPTFGTNLSLTAPTAVAGGANGSISGNALSCSVTTSWQLFGATFSVPAGANNLIPAIWTDSQFAAADTLSVTEAGFYQGANCRPWTPQPPAEEYLRCRRFYWKSFDGWPSGVSGRVCGIALANFVLQVNRTWDMRTAPTVSVTNNNTANQARNSTTGGTVALTIASFADDATGIALLSTSNTPFTSGAGYDFDLTAEAEL